MRFEEWLAKSETKEITEEVVVESTQPEVIVEAKVHKDHVPYEGTNHDMQGMLDSCKKINPRLHASILSWD